MSPDFKEILSTFNRHEVKYMIVGAFAVMKYSEPRFTKDLDIWINNSQEITNRRMTVVVHDRIDYVTFIRELSTETRVVFIIQQIN